MLYTHKHK